MYRLIEYLEDVGKKSKKGDKKEMPAHIAADLVGEGRAKYIEAKSPGRPKKTD